MNSPASDHPLAGLTLVIQAGGQSRRMGTDKALLPFGGRPLLAHIHARLAPLAEAVLVTSNRPEAHAFLGVPCYPDRHPGAGALGGLYTALYYAPTPLVAVVACDMPFASPDLFQRAWAILQDHPTVSAAVPRTERGWEPFHAVYRRALCLPTLERALAQGQRRVQAWLTTLNPHPLPVTEAEALALRNLNTPADYQRALDLWGQTAPEAGNTP